MGLRRVGVMIGERFNVWDEVIETSTLKGQRHKQREGIKGVAWHRKRLVC